MQKRTFTMPLPLEERRRQMILDGLKDIDEGRVFPHSDIKAWAERLVERP